MLATGLFLSFGKKCVPVMDVFYFLHRDVRSNHGCSLETPVEMHVNGKVGTDGLRAV